MHHLYPEGVISFQLCGAIKGCPTGSWFKWNTKWVLCKKIAYVLEDVDPGAVADFQLDGNVPHGRNDFVVVRRRHDTLFLQKYLLLKDI